MITIKFNNFDETITNGYDLYDMYNGFLVDHISGEVPLSSEDIKRVDLVREFSDALYDRLKARGVIEIHYEELEELALEYEFVDSLYDEEVTYEKI